MRRALADGPDVRHDPMPVETYLRLATDRDPRVRLHLRLPRSLPRDVLETMAGSDDPEIAEAARWALEKPQRPERATIGDDEAERLASSDDANDRLRAVRSARTRPRLDEDPDPDVRLWMSMRPDLTEAERAAIDYHVGAADRLPTLDWVRDAGAETLDRCVRSAHIGLRRSATHHPGLTAEHIALLAEDPDFAVRLMLCQQHDEVPPHLVVRTYLEARVITRGNLLHHPAFPRTDLVRYADSPHWGARALVTMDPTAPAELIERLSRDEHPGVRGWMAGDGRLAVERVLELLADEATAEPAASNPALPRAVMEQILTAGADLSPAPVDGVILLGHTNPSYEQIEGF